MRTLLGAGGARIACRPAARDFRHRPVGPSIWPHAASLAAMCFAAAVLAARLLA